MVAAEIHFSCAPLPSYAWASSVGFGALLLIGMQAIWTDGDRGNRNWWGFIGALFLVTSEYFGLNLLIITENPASKVLDLYLISFESSLHIPIAFLFGQAFQKWLWLHLTATFCYVGLFIPVAAVYAGLLVRDRQKAKEALAAFIIAAPIGFVFYRMFPAIGPAAAFQSNFPWHPLTYDEASRLTLAPIFGGGLEMPCRRCT